MKRPAVCIHYTGLQRDSCKAGVIYRDAFGKEPGIANRMPCFHLEGKSPENTVSCALRREQTATEFEAEREDVRRYMDLMKTVLTGIKGWRVKPKPKKDRREVIECPACKGRLHLSQSAYNGHVHGHCETEGCARWME